MDTKPKLIESYLKQLSPHEKVAYTIAVKNLESSFDIEKSIGFLNYVKEAKSKNQHTGS
jgi:hypothetical protein